MYQKALKKTGYNNQLTYQKPINNKNEEAKRHKRKIIWFNSPYSKNVKKIPKNSIPKINLLTLSVTPQILEAAK